jgi:hypothetical protein
MNISDSLFWAIFGAILSTLLSLGLPALISRMKYYRKPNLLGKWKSTYQGIDEPQGTWVKENLYIDTYFGKLRLKNSDSSESYEYIGKAKLVQGGHIVGEWESIRKGANARGGIMLTISEQGDFLYGYWVGSDKAGARRYGKWVLAHSDAKLDEAKRHLEKMIKSRVWKK